MSPCLCGELILRILGIDPGLRFTGYGCVDMPQSQCTSTSECGSKNTSGSAFGSASGGGGGGEPILVEAGVLRLDATKPIPYRLQQLFEDLTQVLEELSPDTMVVEKLFSHYRHAQTSVLMGHARGVILLAGQLRGIELDELPATEVKKAITGHGHATKQQMQLAVMSQCGLNEPPEPPDVADAIGIALCAARRIGVNA